MCAVVLRGDVCLVKLSYKVDIMYNNMACKNRIYIIGFEVLTPVVMKIFVFWDIFPHS
jgi:hypothetical protein